MLLKQVGRIQAIRAPLAAGVAVLALLDEFHLFSPFLSEVDTQRSAAQEQAHAGAVLNLDSDRTRLAITATTAEIARQLLAFLLNLAP